MYKYLFFLFLIFGCVNQVSAATQTVRIYSHESDFSVQTAPYPSLWSTQYYSVYGIDTTAPVDTSLVSIGIYNSQQGYLGIHRSFLSFDTSVIPETAKIRSASLTISPGGSENEVNDTYSYVSVLQGRQSSDTLVTYDDIELCGDVLVNPTKGSDSMPMSQVIAGTPLVFDLNESGLGWIIKDGYTKLCIREGHDIENKEVINNDNYWLTSGFSYFTSEKEGVEFDPYLEVTYEVSDNTEKDMLDLIRELIAAVKGYEFKKNVEHPYMANLKKVEEMLDDTRYEPAENQVQAFVRKLEQDFRHKDITQPQYDDLRARAQALLEAISSEEAE